DIRVYVVGATADSSEVPAAVWREPTLTVAFNPGAPFRPLRGRVICNRPIEKFEQWKMLADAGIDVLHSQVFRFGMELDPAVWGSHVLVKPQSLHMTSHGAGVQLFRRQRLAAAGPQDFPADHHLNRTAMIVQPFIDTGVNPSKFRVLCLCGEPLYAHFTTLVAPRPDLTAPDAELEAADVATSDGERTYTHGDYPEPVALARKVAKVFSEVPLLGVDVIRDARSGKLYVLEVNASGNVWHFSSQLWAERRKRYPELVEQMQKQFGAFDRAAKALIAMTRRLAS
ncbi:MAG: hypothetical protein HY245_13760, partial [Rhizobiales bacterium]|nr:hypothetical protein [Hyphomicrobiales bacterium]